MPRRGRGIPRLWLGAGIGAAPPAAAGLFRPALCLMLTAAELAAVLLFVLAFGLVMTIAILHGSDVTSERAFRLLRFLGNRPEHGPPVAQPGRAAVEGPRPDG